MVVDRFSAQAAARRLEELYDRRLAERGLPPRLERGHESAELGPVPGAGVNEVAL
jgi:hypothetical protein